MKPRELEDDINASLGFMRENGSWVSNLATKNRSILMAPTNFCMLNNVLPSDQISDIHGIKGYWMQHPTSEAHQDDPVQQLFGEVRNMSKTLSYFQLQFEAFQQHVLDEQQ